MKNYTNRFEQFGYRSAWRVVWTLAAAVIASGAAVAQQAKDLTRSLPDAGKLTEGKPAGEGWKSLVPDEKLGEWNAEPEYWSVKDGVMHGESKGGKHHHAWTKKDYGDFELHAVVKMTGAGANSGVCIRLRPTDPDNAPGYQVDMGPGYWGCLWEERRAGMVQKFPKELADQLVKADESPRAITFKPGSTA